MYLLLQGDIAYVYQFIDPLKLIYKIGIGAIYSLNIRALTFREVRVLA